MTLEELRASGHIIFECISGSRAYGLATASSDTDIRGVFVLPKDQFYSLNYVSQVNNETNDIVFYELSKFIELCAKNNPNILELLNVSEDCVVYKHPLFEMLETSVFLSKKCKESFANYAYAQIKKARGLEKKIVNPVEKERKSVLDFCFMYDSGKSVPVRDFLKQRGLSQSNCGLSSIPHLKGCYNVFHSVEIPYKGIVKKEDSNDISLSTIPKGESVLGMMYFNKDGYSTYCKKYREYWEWVEKRNDDRYQTTMNHGKNYDSKNMMHTIRLLLMAKEIAEEGKINVLRNDREYLLDIKQGKFDYDTLVQRADELKNELEMLYENSTLPTQPDLKVVNELLLRMREAFYNEKNK